MKSVDGFTVMTYDASRPDKPGYNAPLPWVENNMELLLDADHAAAQKPKGDDGKNAKPYEISPSTLLPAVKASQSMSSLKG